MHHLGPIFAPWLLARFARWKKRRTRFVPEYRVVEPDAKVR